MTQPEMAEEIPNVTPENFDFLFILIRTLFKLQNCTLSCQALLQDLIVIMAKHTNGYTSANSPTNGIETRAAECSYVLSEVQKLVIPFIEKADNDPKTEPSQKGNDDLAPNISTLVTSYTPKELTKILDPQVPEAGQGSNGLLEAVQKTMQYSVNTWNKGFMDKLYASTDAPGLAAELVLATLNTNLHVYAVSPALTVIEKYVTKALAKMFGLDDDDSGGISVQGGAASNLTSLLVARNYRYPKVKREGMSALTKPLALFTSAESHYSVSSAAVSLGFGTNAIHVIPVDNQGCMEVTKLKTAIQTAIDKGEQPFYVSATAGTTVRGAYDPLYDIGQICKEFDLWYHIDAAWGGPAVFSRTHKYKLDGSQLADSIACNPHKMMGVPLTCSFLLARDLRKFYAANSLSAGYLFHEDPEDILSAPEMGPVIPSASDIYDLASFTPQCGRRGDSLKLYLSWIYHGTLGYEQQIDAAFSTCQYMVTRVLENDVFHVISSNPPPCCQCCFYYRPQRLIALQNGDRKHDSLLQTKVTRRIVTGLVPRGWMVDYAPGELGEFLRVVTNRGTTNEVIDSLLKAIIEVGTQVIAELSS